MRHPRPHYGQCVLTVDTVYRILFLVMTPLPDLPPKGTAANVGARHNTRDYPGTPRWVKAFGIAVVVLLLAFIMIAHGGGRHSPLHHLRSGSDSGHTPAAERVPQP